MVTRPRLRSFFTALGLYVLAALLIGYFGVNAYTGDHGLRARQDLDRQIAALTTELGQATAERDLWERRVKLLKSDSVDPDMTDPIDATGTRGSGVFTTNVYVADPLVQVVQVTTIRVTVTVQKVGSSTTH